MESKMGVDAIDRRVDDSQAVVTAKGSAEELRKSFGIILKTSYLVGINLFVPERQVPFRFVFSVLLMIVIYIQCFYTLWVLRNEWEIALEVLLVLMLNFQGTSKIWVGFVEKHSYYLLFVSTEEIYAKFDEVDRNRPVLRRTLKMMVIMLKAMVILYTGAGALIFLAITLMVLVTRESFLLLRVYVPFVDHSTPAGYAITTASHVLMIMYCVNGYLASDCVFLSCIIPIVGYANSFEKEIEHLNDMLTMANRNEKQITQQLMRIVKLHQMIVEYENAAIQFFKGANLAQIGLQAGLLLVLVFMCLVLRYFQAFSVSVVIFFELTLFCSVGTIITVKNNQMMADIYNINWHLLQKHQQQMVAFMLHRAQIAKDLYVGNFAPLNMETYVQILKTVYTFLTMLVTMMGMKN